MNSKKPKISACLVIYNEEQLLPRCLDSIKDVVDEIIIVHDGNCTDNSLVIAKKYGAVTFERTHIGEAEYHRPFSYSKATGDWVLHIDADEYLSLPLKKTIQKLVKSIDYDCYAFGWPLSVDGKYVKSGYFSKEPRPTLFRRSKMYMLGLTHEHPRSYGKTKNLPELILHHKPKIKRVNIKYTYSNLVGQGSYRAKIKAYQIKNLSTLPRYNIENPEQNKTYKYYDRIRRRPILMGIYTLLRLVLSYIQKGVLIENKSSFRIALYRVSITLVTFYYIVKAKYQANFDPYS